jgi:hypothetical protein
MFIGNVSGLQSFQSVFSKAFAMATDVRWKLCVVGHPGKGLVNFCLG